MGREGQVGGTRKEGEIQTIKMSCSAREGLPNGNDDPEGYSGCREKGRPVHQRGKRTRIAIMTER